MSLINDALKKAQKQRTGEAPSLHSLPSVGGESPQRIARRSKPAGFNTLMVRAAIASAAALVIAIGGYFVLRPKAESGKLKVEGQAVANQPSTLSPQPSQIAGSPLAAPSAATTTQVSATKSQVSEPPAPLFTLKTDPVAKLEATPKPEPKVAESKPAAQSPSQQTAAAPQPSALSLQPSVSSSQSSAVSEPPKPALKLAPHAIEFIENLKVAGIRASTTDPKVLMNDRVYRPGSIVSADLGLKLAEITANSLTFEDERGGRYTRTF